MSVSTLRSKSSGDLIRVGGDLRLRCVLRVELKASKSISWRLCLHAGGMWWVGRSTDMMIGR